MPSLINIKHLIDYNNTSVFRITLPDDPPNKPGQITQVRYSEVRAEFVKSLQGW